MPQPSKCLCFNSFRKDFKVRVLTTLVCSSQPLRAISRTQPEKTGVFIPMRRPVDDALYPLAFCVRPQPPVQVKPVRIAVQLNPRAGPGARINHRLRVDRIRLALQQQPAGQVADDVDKFVLRRPDQRLVFSASLVGRNVQTGHHHVRSASNHRRNPDGCAKYPLPSGKQSKITARDRRTAR